MNTRPIPTKVSRLIPMLGSPADHEALSAARAIGRVLSREGLGFTDLAAAIPAQLGAQGVKVFTPGEPVRTPAATVPEFHAYRWRRAFTPAQEQRHRAMVAFCAEHPWRLSPRERSFITNISRLAGNITIPQHDWLCALTDRLEQEGRRAC